MRFKLFCIVTIIAVGALNIFAQTQLPRASQRASLTQTVGDTQISIIYHRPNVKKRTVFGDLVPYGEVWRTGANEATVFEVSKDVTINGQKLPAGKYSFYAIPGEKEWTIIFNKTWDQWGTIYDAKQDALRVKVKPMESEFEESLAYEIENVTENTAQVSLRWEKLAVPFVVDIGDITKRILDSARNDKKMQVQVAGYIFDAKLAENYNEALSWLDAAIKESDNYRAMFYKARLLGEMGKKQEAIMTAEKAIELGKKSPNINTSFLEGLVKEWKESK
jgi:tetratricopeptide (TPR) repeat protein